MDAVIEFIKANPELVGTVLTILMGLLWKIKKTNKFLAATAKYAHILADAIEKGENKKAGDLVVEAAKKRLGTADEAVRAVNNLIVKRVDPKPDENVPAIKRFWRRTLNGENLVGNIVGNTVVNTLEGQVKRHLR